MLKIKKKRTTQTVINEDYLKSFDPLTAEHAETIVTNAGIETDEALDQQITNATILSMKTGEEIFGQEAEDT